MSFRSTRSLILSNLHQIPGWKTDRKIVVFESDDWGSIRMPSKATYLKVNEKGITANSNYNKYDNLASQEDLEALFNVLLSFKDRFGRNPAITANCLMANPDFKKIRQSEYCQYHYELFLESFKNFKGCENSLSYWHEGIRLGIFEPQFHGREHLNVNLWIKALRDNHPTTRLAFDFGFWGQQTDYQSAKRKHFLAAYDYALKIEIGELKSIIKDGVNIFKNTFGYQPVSFTAPNYIWDSDLEDTLREEKVSIIQSQQRQLIPISGEKGYKTRAHFTGKRNSLNQVFIVRNARFEPSLDQKVDWVDSCLSDLKRAFFWKKPAIISVHRVNFIGSIEPENRNHNLRLFRKLLGRILDTWPDIEFLTPNGLVKVIGQNEG